MIYVFIGFFCVILGFSIYSSRFNDPYRHIILYMAKPGQGKSTSLVHQILKYQKINNKLRKKGLKEWSIYVNFPVNIPGVRLFDPLDISKYWADEKSVLMIDEVTLIWDSRKFKTFEAGVTEFMKLHRHAECIIYLASQNFDFDLRIRDLTTSFNIVNKIGMFCLIRPVQIIFPRFTGADSSHGSDIVSEYTYTKFWKWRLYFMPKYFQYFNTKQIPYRPPMPYKIIPCKYMQDFKLDVDKIAKPSIKLESVSWTAGVS